VLNLALSVAAWAAGISGLAMAGWGVFVWEPRLMTAALGWIVLSLAICCVAWAAAGRLWPALYHAIALLVVSATMARTWPQGWNPYRQLREELRGARFL
jgi:hypothetical protein